MAQLLCAGEFKAAIDLYAYRLADLKRTRGCPVRYLTPDPAPATPSPVGVIKKTPRPYAAALLDYILSEAAQKIFADFGRNSARRGVRPRYPRYRYRGEGSQNAADAYDAVQFDKPYQQLREEFLLNR